MTTWTPTLLRWTEEAEARHVREWAAFDREQACAVARSTAETPQTDRLRRWSAVCVRAWFGDEEEQIG
jgi:hypothetical protein